MLVVIGTFLSLSFPVCETGVSNACPRGCMRIRHNAHKGPGHRDGAINRSYLFPSKFYDLPPLGRNAPGLVSLGWELGGWSNEPSSLANTEPWEGQAVLTTEDRSTFSTLLSCSITGCRPATRSCTEDVRYTKLSSQSPLRAQKGMDVSLGGAPGRGWALPSPGEARGTAAQGMGAPRGRLLCSLLGPQG